MAGQVVVLDVRDVLRSGQSLTASLTGTHPVRGTRAAADGDSHNACCVASAFWLAAQLARSVSPSAVGVSGSAV